MRRREFNSSVSVSYTHLSEYFRKPATITGSGTGFWEAPRGALYHSEKVVDGKIEGYQIIIPTTWNAAPHNANGENAPMEEDLIGVRCV